MTGTFPATITLNAGYTGPDNAALAEYDPGDGIWRTYTDKTITRLGSYIAFRGDWRTSAGTYSSMFRATLQSAAYTCEFSGAFTAYPSHASAYMEMFQDCSAVTGIRDNPVPVLTGAPAGSMFSYMCRGMSGVTGPLPAGFADTSGLTGAPAVSMYREMCRDMAITNGNIIIGENLTLDATNVVTMTEMMRGCGSWEGEVFWGSGLLVEQVTPSTKILTFYGCTNMPGFATLHENWKDP